VNGPIGKQMVDTFFESSANFEVSVYTIIPHEDRRQEYETDRQVDRQTIQIYKARQDN